MHEDGRRVLMPTECFQPDRSLASTGSTTLCTARRSHQTPPVLSAGEWAGSCGMARSVTRY